MSAPTVSLILTIHNRTREVTQAVRDSFNLEGNAPDEAIIVLDRPTDEARKAAVAAWSGADWPVKFVEIPGQPKWMCPARAWNYAYEAATGDLLYQISSEVVQAGGNVERARVAVAHLDVALFGACTNSVQRPLVNGAPLGFLAGSAMPRPLGFIVCMPRAKMRAIGGNDEDFMEGLWYEDDDLFYRLWQSGLDFIFDDAISGVHLDHDRPDLSTPEGQAAIQRNAALMMKKHGTTHPFQLSAGRLSHSAPGRVRWFRITETLHEAEPSPSEAHSSPDSTD